MRWLNAVLGTLVLASPFLAEDVQAQSTALARGRILTDSAERAIEGATISIPQLRVATTSDSLGRFQLAGIEAGEHLVLVRRLGFSPLSTVVKFAAGESVDADFLLEVARQRLSGVRVRGEGVPAKLSEFEERRRFGIGSFLNTEEIEKLGATRVSDALRTLPGLMLTRLNARGELYVASTRGAQSLLRAGGGKPCPAEIWLDGIVVSRGQADINSIVPLSEIAAMEWYAGAAQIPVKYSATKNACAVLVIWTK